ncbi:hypothetical protein R5R73_04980 [Salinicola sp. LHM]|uniref:hypothetical protein n=1 Tax=Salinicola sp. LHM TaxID=3065298 RepID=UPI002ACE3725|nr:hypothetical protein [Salinicola sp. LHM]WQH34043.1 hypothetical protein R5R73_04980 [Salinicola sp. LHM]
MEWMATALTGLPNTILGSLLTISAGILIWNKQLQWKYKHEQTVYLCTLISKLEAEFGKILNLAAVHQVNLTYPPIENNVYKIIDLCHELRALSHSLRFIGKRHAADLAFEAYDLASSESQNLALTLHVFSDNVEAVHEQIYSTCTTSKKGLMEKLSQLNKD